LVEPGGEVVCGAGEGGQVGLHSVAADGNPGEGVHCGRLTWQVGPDVGVVGESQRGDVVEDLRELQGQQGVDVLCAFLRAIGSRLGKPVLMTPESGSQEHPVLGYDSDLGKVTLR
jgi:hypothetical protein